MITFALMLGGVAIAVLLIVCYGIQDPGVSPAESEDECTK